jgi:hypothetical protein
VTTNGSFAVLELDEKLWYRRTTGARCRTTPRSRVAIQGTRYRGRHFRFRLDFSILRSPIGKAQFKIVLTMTPTPNAMKTRTLSLVLMKLWSLSSTSPALDSRLLSPIFVPIVLLVAVGLDEMSISARRLVTWSLVTLTAVSVALLSALSADATVGQVLRFRTDGVPGATSRAVRSQPVIVASCHLPRGKIMVSNDRWTLAF